MIIIRLRRGSSVKWATSNPILEAGEAGYETDTGVFKIGDGVTHWADLKGYLPEDEMLQAVQVAVANALLDESAISAAIDVHVNDPEPHPAYDDGPSFVLLYENVKV